MMEITLLINKPIKIVSCTIFPQITEEPRILVQFSRFFPNLRFHLKHNTWRIYTVHTFTVLILSRQTNHQQMKLREEQERKKERNKLPTESI